MSLHRGDDLEDDFIPDDTVALSDSEGNAEGHTHDIEQLLSADEEYAAAAKSQSDGISDKKRKRREKHKEKKAKRRKLEESAESAEADYIAARSPAALAEYLSSAQAKSLSRLSTLELQDRAIPENSLADTTQWKGLRTLDRLEDFIISAVPSLHTRLSQRTKSPGSPTLLFITGAALRVTDVTRVLRSKKLRGEKGGEVAKLFAKHFKLQEHVAYLKKTKVGSAVGTPSRIGKLLCDTDALTVSALSHIVLDISYQDAKKRNLLDIPETRDEVFKTVLAAPLVLEGIKSGKIQVVLF
ncbi:U3-containing 90S pre-ribosomal complex subunit-domain containing protein [Vararia minispora EC-137]|uniref:U3-containing 90S pre-ribosomal complex subunit-domain containing protein n=1 Tax=Vararia minispora EC-137 TaxID=1314806 RepID=A0ACB8QDF5_9AGAM|nr:U3-containing 90S pre-ribosomal complex subunit-domain containing protein [Vararia minispora EC-137]